MLFQLRNQLRPFGFLDGDEIFDADGIHDLTTETLGQDAGADAFAGGVNRGGSTRWATTDDEHIVRCLSADLFSFAGSGTGVELGENFFDGHTTRTELFAI